MTQPPHCDLEPVSDIYRFIRNNQNRKPHYIFTELRKTYSNEQIQYVLDQLKDRS